MSRQMKQQMAARTQTHSQGSLGMVHRNKAEGETGGRVGPAGPRPNVQPEGLDSPLR